MNNFFYGIFPYLAFTLAIAGGIYRYFTDRFSFSSLSSQFLENRTLYWGSVEWNYGIGLILLGHLFGGLFPGASAFLLRGATRLFIGECVGMSLGLFTLLGIVLLIMRGLTHSRIQAVTSVMDWILIAALTAQVMVGVLVAFSYRWGSLWYLDTAVPWFWSIASFTPNFSTILVLPWLVKFHVFNGFLIIALFPFSRLVHIFTVPISYLWGSFRVVIWSRRAVPVAAEIAAAARPGEIPGVEGYAPGAEPQGKITRRGFLAVASAVLTFFVVLVAGIPMVGELVGGIYRERKRQWSKVTALAPLPIGQPVNPAFPMPVVQAYIRQTELRKVWVIKHSATEVTVFSPVCPHLGCHYNWDPKTQHFECPCHGSVYTINGKVIGGPAPRGLDTLPEKIEGGILYVKWEEFRVGIPQKILV
jgi:nitrate reductase gamma subunit